MTALLARHPRLLVYVAGALRIEGIFERDEAANS
jgi:hypothetical protein